MAGGSFGGGSGTAEDPYLVEDIDDFRAIGVWDERELYNKYFKQVTDLDLDVSPWNGGSGWEPVGGVYGPPFAGDYDGDNHKISNLMINSTEYTVGLFRLLENTGKVRNLHLENVNVHSTQYGVGALAGIMDGTGPMEVVNCTVIGGSVSGDGNAVGGLIGGIYGWGVSSCIDCYTEVMVSGGGAVGGLAGSISASTAIILNCYATGDVAGDGDSVGGFAGYVSSSSSATITDCHATGNVVATGSYVGGFLGQGSDLIVTNCYATGNVSGVDYVGGFAGRPYQWLGEGKLSNCYATGDVLGNYAVGGFLGQGEINLEECYATGSVEGSDQNVGGFAGYLFSPSSSTVTITNCYATGAVSGARNVGGFAGYTYPDGVVENCYALGNAEGSSSYVGGFIGYLGGGECLYRKCYATGSASGTEYVGGFCGWVGSENNIENCYAIGNVTATTQGSGGFCGIRVSGNFSYCYSIGEVSAPSDVGGFLGADWSGDVVITSCYYDTETSGQSDDDGRGEPKTTAEMKTQSTFVGWNFDSIWALNYNALFTVKSVRENKPVEGATVYFNNTQQDTDENGQTIFTDVTPGTQALSVEKTGYIPYDERLASGGYPYFQWQDTPEEVYAIYIRYAEEPIPDYPPMSVIKLNFRAGDSEQYPMGTFYVDRTSTRSRSETFTIEARNAIGKFLKDQTFDENNIFPVQYLPDIIEQILNTAGITRYEIGYPKAENFIPPEYDMPDRPSYDPFNPDRDPNEADATEWTNYTQALITIIMQMFTDGMKPKFYVGMEYPHDMNFSDGIRELLDTVSNWDIRERADGQVVVGDKDDLDLFDQPAKYTIYRNRDAWSRQVDRDDMELYSRVCVYADPAEEDGEEVRVYRAGPVYEGWTLPAQKTLYHQAPDGTTQTEAEELAEEIAAAMAGSGSVETFVGPWRPHLQAGDEVEIMQETGEPEALGIATVVKHTFSKRGYMTEFEVDSGGRIGKMRLKDFLEKSAEKAQTTKAKRLG